MTISTLVSVISGGSTPPPIPIGYSHYININGGTGTDNNLWITIEDNDATPIEITTTTTSLAYGTSVLPRIPRKTQIPATWETRDADAFFIDSSYNTCDAYKGGSYKASMPNNLPITITDQVTPIYARRIDDTIQG